MILLPLRIPSDNELWQGRRFKTKAYKQFERDAGMLLRASERPYKAGDRLRVVVRLFWRRAGLRDASNALKCIGDILTKLQVIPDDRYIWRWEVEKIKIPITQEEYAEIEITDLEATETGV